MAPWASGNSTTTLTTQLVEFIDTWLTSDNYVSRIPREHRHLLRMGDKQNAGIKIIIATQRSEGESYSYILDGEPVMRESHRIGIMVKVDKRAGGLPAAEAVMGVIKSMFGCPESTEEREDLISRGLYNAFESAEEIDLDPGGLDDEAEVFNQSVSLACETEILIH